jgi:ferredoxin
MSWKSFFVEEEEKKTVSKPAPGLSASMAMSIATANAANVPSVSGSPFTAAAAVVLDESVYQRVFAKTDFDQTDVAKAIHRYFDALPDVLDTNTKFKTAMAQASKLDGVTADKVLAAFDGLKTKLQSEQDGFANAVGQQTQKEVSVRQQKLQDINDQIAKLTQSIVEDGYAEAAQLYINPEECIDCGACVPVCPVTAIFPEAEVPAESLASIEENADYYGI